MITPVPPLNQTPTAASVVPTDNSTATTDFTQMLTNGVLQVNDALQASDVAMQSIAAGDESNLSKKMLAIEEAKTTLTFAIEVRNKVVEAYQELMKMPI